MTSYSMKSASMVGRGTGKNGFISFLYLLLLVTLIMESRGYNVDLMANTEEQAKTSFRDVYEVITDPVESKVQSSAEKELSRHQRADCWPGDQVGVAVQHLFQSGARTVNVPDVSFLMRSTSTQMLRT